MTCAPIVTVSRELVVLTHGFLGSRIQLLPVAAALSRRYDVFNFGYRSRRDTLSGHAHTLLEAMDSRVGRTRQNVHFVTHSFGGLVVHKAFSLGLADILGDRLPNTRCVFIAPPIRGASLARAFRKENVAGPEVVKDFVQAAAQSVMGDNCGQELMMKEPRWFEENVGNVPEEVEVLVVAGSYGKLNPLIVGESDGVVAVEETMLRRSHYRLQVNTTHNLLLYTPKVLTSIAAFLQGDTVGTLRLMPQKAEVGS